MWPGDFVNGQLIVETRLQALTVPAAAVRHGPSGDFLWLVRADKTVQIRKVEVAQTAGGRALIARGISNGEQFVTDGHFLLEDGRQIEIVDADKALPSASGANARSADSGG